MCGTPNYISPEIVSRLPYGLASDIWSVGCMMVSMLTGSPPFQSDDVKRTLELVSRGEFSLPPSISPQACDFINKILQKDPAKRPLMRDLLGHPFFAQEMPMRSLSLPSQILPRKTNLPPNKSFLGEHNSTDKLNRKVTKDKISKESNFLSKNALLLPQKLSIPVPAFSTTRLKQMTQTTKHGSVQIHETGKLILDFTGDPFIIYISPDSRTISLFDRSNHNSTNSSPLFTYPSSHLPQSLVKKYRYAARFVELVRTKTPMVRKKLHRSFFTLRKPSARCLKMELISLSYFIQDSKCTFHLKRQWRSQFHQKLPGSIIHNTQEILL